MDYCHPCGRHLNGALACAGCGTPVEELRRLSFAPAAANTPVYELERDPEPEPAPPVPRSARRQAASRRKPAPSGRRARKKRGRKLAVGTVGLALAAGALGFAQFAEGPGDDGAATAVKERAVVETESAEPTPSDQAPEGPAEVTEKPVASSGAPRPGRTAVPVRAPGKGGSGTAAAAPDTASPSPSATREPEEAAPSASASASPSGGAPSGGPGTQAPSPGPPPPAEPSPTPTCERFLWWCL
ncbi:SCO2400 family protein [Streptomyces zhihengii]